MEGSCVRSLCYQVERGYGESRLTTDGTREKASQADLFVPVNWVSVDLWNSARSPEVGGVQ